MNEKDVEAAGRPHDVATVRISDPIPRSKGKKSLSFYMSILMLAMIALIVSWDVTALSLALPVIANRLGGTNFQSFWASIAFILGIAVTQPIYSSISDVMGRKQVLYVAIALFGVGCIVFATAKDMSTIIVGRLIKGLGAGGLDVLQTMILCDITTMKERARWLGVLSSANAVGAVTGPFIGGAFAQDVGWPWLGWINLIAAGITGVLTFFFLHLTPIEGDLKTKARKLDWSGFALFTIIGTIIALPLSWGNTLYPWGSWRTLVPLLIGIVLLISFGFVEKRATAPMIPYKIFDNISFITGIVSGFLYGSLLNPVLLYLPLFYQAVYLETPIVAAKSILPLCCLVVSASIIASIIIEWSRKYRATLWTGWILSTVFMGLLYIIGGYVYQTFLGAGLGTALMATMIATLASVTSVDNEGLAAGMLVTSRFLGSLIGLAVCSTVFSSAFGARLAASIGDLPPELETLRDPSQAVQFIEKLRSVSVSPEVLQNTVWIVLMAFSGFAALISVFTRENSLEKSEIGRQGLQTSAAE
ncbi:MFS general substrate transporter [Dissoconium aciculare CBS 342.82]|uniref:MFS general substrate transporter n=1 Tax=Dissoconium aciculare CBS 342.82 TaxID=1314786 RepID=A0A6J3LTU2_9PEZI|nr:MFS general substrate transporter [Dissoconium aciculare CBS 342.82]KAF1818037.1 MFS general substrate transporter [Dissoconium aciculare CBS 342.82]